MIVYFIFKIVPAILVLLGAIYLVSVKLNPTKRQAVMRKLEEGTPAYDMYARVYSTPFMIGSILLAATFILGVAFDVYRSGHTPSTVVIGMVFAVSILVSLLGLYFDFKKSK